MTTYKNVIQAGVAGSSIGKPTFDAIRDAGIPVTALIRVGSSSVVPTGVPVKTIDYTDYPALVNALRGHDALVLTLGYAGALEHSKRFVDAAIEAGVQRIIPSEFGADTEHALAQGHPIYSPKIEISAYIKLKAAEGKITYTNVITGSFLDRCLESTFLGFDIKNHTALLWDGGKYAFRTSSNRTIAQSVVGILRNPSGTSNKTIRISDAIITQLDILSLLESLTSQKFTVSEITTKEAARIGGEGLKKGDASFENLRGLLNSSVLGEESVGRWGDEESGNRLVGLSEHPADWKKVVEETVRKTTAA